MTGVYHTRHDPTVVLLVEVVPLHCVRFAGAGLSVGHDGAVETLDDVVEDWSGYLIKDFILSGVHVEHFVVHEGHLACSDVFDEELRVVVDVVQAAGIGC